MGFICAFTWLKKVEYSKNSADFLSQRNTFICIRELGQGLIAADVRGAIRAPAASLPLLQQGVLNRGKWHKRKISFGFELFRSALGFPCDGASFLGRCCKLMLVAAGTSISKPFSCPLAGT